MKTFAQQLRQAENERKIRVIYISSYIPRQCGIATFTKDLTSAINLLNPRSLAEIVAVNPPSETFNYPWEVKFRFTQDDDASYQVAADYINQSSAELVCLQHEYGLYYSDGDLLYEKLLPKINKPIVTCMHRVSDIHTVDVYYAKMAKILANESKALVVMSQVAADRLEHMYGVDPRKIVIIPHGIPDVPLLLNPRGKASLDLRNRTVISTFGLLRDQKGLEYVIEALPKIIKHVPNIIYTILGETHPGVLRAEGEKYRKKLQSLVRKLGLQQHVRFENRYLSLKEVIQYLQASDIYVTPYLSIDQVTSGTLSYAVGAGLPCISTKYTHAIELLDEDRGLLVNFANPEQIADAVLRLTKDKKYRTDMRQRAYLYGRQMTWPNVALKHLDLFSTVVAGSKKISRGI